MIKIAPAAVISKYLEANSRFEGDLARTAIGLMEDGYQRQLAYKLRDGSFSPFGESDRRGSTWVTALVARDEFLSHVFIRLFLLHVRGKSSIESLVPI